MAVVIPTYPTSAQPFASAIQPVQVKWFPQQQHRDRHHGHQDQKNLQPSLRIQQEQRRVSTTGKKIPQKNTSSAAADNIANLSWVKRSHILPLHHKHVDEVDEDAGRLAGVPRAVRQPLVDNHEHQVAEEAEEEEQLGNKQQVDAELLSEVPAKEVEGKEKQKEGTKQ